MNRLEVRQLVVIRVDADAEEEAGVSSVHDLVVSELAISSCSVRMFGKVVLLSAVRTHALWQQSVKAIDAERRVD